MPRWAEDLTLLFAPGLIWKWDQKTGDLLAAADLLTSFLNMLAIDDWTKVHTVNCSKVETCN